MCARAVAAGIVQALLTTLHTPCLSGPNITADTMRVLTQIIVGTRDAVSPAEAAQARGAAVAAMRDHEDNFMFAADVRSSAEALLRVLPVAAACLRCGAAAAADGGRLKRCGACKRAAYCSTACQAAHWREHRPECGPAP